mgnify:CR=1 FL=1
MNSFDDEINEFIEGINKEEIPLEKQIENLKKYSKQLNDYYLELSDNLLFGTFISSAGLGLGISDPYIGVSLIVAGMSVCVISSKISTTKFEKTYKNKVLQHKKN